MSNPLKKHFESDLGTMAREKRLQGMQREKLEQARALLIQVRTVLQPLAASTSIELRHMRFAWASLIDAEDRLQMILDEMTEEKKL